MNLDVRVRDSYEEEEDWTEFELESVAAATIVVSAGAATWALRTGSLVAGSLSIVPTWRFFEPLPILGKEAGFIYRDTEENEQGVPGHIEDIDVENMFDQKRPGK